MSTWASWLTFIESCDSCDLLFVSGRNALGYSWCRLCGGGVVGNLPFEEGLTRGGVCGGVNRFLCSAGEGNGSGEPGMLIGGVSEGVGLWALRCVSAGKEDVEGLWWWGNFGEPLVYELLVAADLYEDQCKSWSKLAISPLSCCSVLSLNQQNRVN